MNHKQLQKECTNASKNVAHFISRHHVPELYEDSEYLSLTGITKNNFNDVLKMIPYQKRKRVFDVNMKLFLTLHKIRKNLDLRTLASSNYNLSDTTLRNHF